ncbi:MAG TPA: Rieske 2Fe-2S domain-containing protein [Myxococcota bacterium]|nr:Rieske 2Fe-2S domain-containing protein [Myxococcota bacterium]HQK49866.1 Rieske 2Fe-2S domain-containing protein [Myxococcota bacterium]
MKRIDLGTLDDWAVGEGRRVSAGEDEVLVVRVGDRLVAVGAFCSHEDLPLEGGSLVGEDLWECPHHGGRVVLSTGAPGGMPVVAPVATFPVREVEGRLVLEVE